MRCHRDQYKSSNSAKRKGKYKSIYEMTKWLETLLVVMTYTHTPPPKNPYEFNDESVCPFTPPLSLPLFIFLFTGKKKKKDLTRHDQQTVGKM